MSILHAVLYNGGPLDSPVAQPTSLWWRRKGLWPSPEGWDYVIKCDPPWTLLNTWTISLEFYDHLDTQLPVDAFKVIDHENLLGDFLKDRLQLRRKPQPWLDILAPFPPSITHWEPLTWTGQHEWPGLGRDGYLLNYGGYHSHVGAQSSP